MNKRGAYFFVIDAFIAASIIFFSLILIFTTYNIRPDTGSTLRMLKEYTEFLTNTRVRDFQGDYVRNLTTNKNITSLDNTLLEQLVEFYYYNSSGKNMSMIMWNFVDEVSKGVISEQRSFAVYINDTRIYNKTNKPLDESDLVMNSKKIVFHRINETYIYGPVVFEVSIWV
ncbi:MAG TPA: hypothetical protein ENL16_02195 [Candidatus Woesearchaeota archaeon]|nr:hypothetical protein [Candidatus Woesearchaeota archaeon]